MLVNVSCASCTDEDEDDGDLLSCSTLTEEERRGGGDEEEEEGRSSGSSEDEEGEVAVERCEYMRKELHNWMRPPSRLSFTCSSPRGEPDLQDELQCGSSDSSSDPTSSCTVASATPHGRSASASSDKERSEREENRRSYLRRLVDDVENGNAAEDLLLLRREEAGLFVKNQEEEEEEEEEEEVFRFGHVTSEDLLPSPGHLSLLLPPQPTSLVGQLRGELPCQSPSLPSPPSLSPAEEPGSRDASRPPRGRRSLTVQERFAFSSLVTEESRREVRDKEESSLTPTRPHSACCHSSPLSLHPSCTTEKREEAEDEEKNKEETEEVEEKEERGEEENTTTCDIVKEIIHMSSQVQTPGQGEVFRAQQNPSLLSQIREKILEHSHRPLHLSDGDFYSYLSLSSHDSDCGEVTASGHAHSSSPAPYSIPCYTAAAGSAHGSAPRCDADAPCTCEDRYADGPQCPPTPGSSPGPSPGLREEEALFPACTEEVYLGPPLCYGVALPRRRPSPLHPYTSVTRPSSSSLSSSSSSLPRSSSLSSSFRPSSSSLPRSSSLSSSLSRSSSLSSSSPGAPAPPPPPPPPFLPRSEGLLWGGGGGGGLCRSEREKESRRYSPPAPHPHPHPHCRRGREGETQEEGSGGTAQRD